MTLAKKIAQATLLVERQQKLRERMQYRVQRANALARLKEHIKECDTCRARYEALYGNAAEHPQPSEPILVPDLIPDPHGPRVH